MPTCPVLESVYKYIGSVLYITLFRKNAAIQIQSTKTHTNTHRHTHTKNKK